MIERWEMIDGLTFRQIGVSWLTVQLTSDFGRIVSVSCEKIQTGLVRDVSRSCLVENNIKKYYFVKTRLVLMRFEPRMMSLNKFGRLDFRVPQKVRYFCRKTANEVLVFFTNLEIPNKIVVWLPR